MKSGDEAKAEDIKMKLIAMAISFVSSSIHFIQDGFFSVAHFSSVAYHLVILYTCSDDYKVQRVQKNNKMTNFVQKHASSILAGIRVLLLSLCDASTVSLYFAYISLCLAFSDDTQVELVEVPKVIAQPQLRNVYQQPLRPNRRPAAPAG